jgi:hypothetical protein
MGSKQEIFGSKTGGYFTRSIYKVSPNLYGGDRLAAHRSYMKSIWKVYGGGGGNRT